MADKRLSDLDTKLAVHGLRGFGIPNRHALLMPEYDGEVVGADSPVEVVAGRLLALDKRDLGGARWKPNPPTARYEGSPGVV